MMGAVAAARWLRAAPLMAALAVLWPAARSGDAVDVEALLVSARVAQEADIDAWSRRKFARVSLKERLDRAGRIVERERLESRVIPLPGTKPPRFEELLLRANGEPATPRQVEEHARDAPFSRRYAALLEGEAGEDEGGFSLAYLLRMSSYRHAGLESVAGVRCHRVEFGPGPTGIGAGKAGRIAEAMDGTIWITEDGLHILKATARAARPISIAFGIVRITDLSVELDSVEASGAWLPARIVMKTTGHVLGFDFRRRYTYLYSDFEPVPEETGLRVRPSASPAPKSSPS